MITKTFSFFLVTVFSTSAYFLNEEECLNYTVYPVQYDLTIIPYVADEQRSYYDCNIIITVIANALNIGIIELDAKDLEIQTDSVKVLYNNERDIIYRFRPIDFDRRLGKLYIYLKEDLEQYSLRKTQYFIKMSFRKKLKSINDADGGIFIIPYQEHGRQKYLITTHLTLNKAKYFYPCFDNPQFEAVFKFKVYQSSKEGHATSLVIANEQRTTAIKDNYEIIEFNPSPQVATYQTGFHYSDFNSQKTTSHISKDTIVLWAPNANLPQYSYILQAGQSNIDRIVKYSGGKAMVNGVINLVAVPAEFHRYEVGSWNLLTIGDHKLSYSPQHTSINQKEDISLLLSEHLSNIWLGNPSEAQRTRWRQEWFKEGISTYFGYYFWSQSGSSALDFDSYLLSVRHSALSVDCCSTPSLDSFNRTLAVDLPSRYRSLVGKKTAALMWMVEHWLGSEKFHAAFRKYINSRRGQIISVEDFTSFLGSETVECEFFKGYTAGDVLNSWLKTPGYPVVKVTVYRNEGKEDVVLLEQKHFTFSNKPHAHQYVIPISYITQHTERCYNCFQPKFTIDGSGYTFKENLLGGWIILNRNASGYYRVNYDTETWKMIIVTLKGPERYQIDAMNRAQIMNDAIALYMSSDLSFSIASDLISSLENEDDPRVWDAAISGFDILRTEGASINMDKYVYNEWKAIFRDAISPTYRRLSVSGALSGAGRAHRARVACAACRAGLAACIRDAESLRGRESYDPDLRAAWYFALLNRSGGFDSIRVTNVYEEEDLKEAEKLSKEEVRFQLRLPKGRPRPMPLMERVTSTTHKPVVAVTQAPVKAPHDSASSVVISYYLLMIASVLTLQHR